MRSLPRDVLQHVSTVSHGVTHTKPNAALAKDEAERRSASLCVLRKKAPPQTPPSPGRFLSSSPLNCFADTIDPELKCVNSTGEVKSVATSRVRDGEGLWIEGRRVRRRLAPFQARPSPAPAFVTSHQDSLQKDIGRSIRSCRNMAAHSPRPHSEKEKRPDGIRNVQPEGASSVGRGREGLIGVEKKTPPMSRGRETT